MAAMILPCSATGIARSTFTLARMYSSILARRSAARAVAQAANSINHMNPIARRDRIGLLVDLLVFRTQ
ncbi:MAG: hypothetical protein ACREPW_04890, partial [Candidatus Binataceae bacterium]